jgi:hypothetical protein
MPGRTALAAWSLDPGHWRGAPPLMLYASDCSLHRID